MRLFLAVFPPEGTQALAGSVIRSLKRPRDGVTWVRSENLHYTLRFIGDVGEIEARQVEDAAFEAASLHKSFGATLGPPGAFPTAKRARVLWLGLLDGVEPFAQLAHSLEVALERRGFERDAREFTAHLTLGRIREPADWTSTLLHAHWPERSADARFTVGSIDVVGSELGPGGSRYSIRATAPLAD